jgi:hypothetical protein
MRIRRGNQQADVLPPTQGAGRSRAFELARHILPPEELITRAKDIAPDGPQDLTSFSRSGGKRQAVEVEIARLQAGEPSGSDGTPRPAGGPAEGAHSRPSSITSRISRQRRGGSRALLDAARRMHLTPSAACSGSRQERSARGKQ